MGGKSGKGGKSTLSDSFPRNIHRNNALSINSMQPVATQAE